MLNTLNKKYLGRKGGPRVDTQIVESQMDFFGLHRHSLFMIVNKGSPTNLHQDHLEVSEPKMILG